MRYRHVPSAIGPVTIEVVRDTGLWHAEISWRDQRSVSPISPDGMCRTCGRLIIDVAVTEDGLVLVRH